MSPEPGPHGHAHDGGEHDHDHVEVEGPLEDNPIWQQENVTLHSVGVDVGSSGTQVAFSRLHLRRIGVDLASRYVVVERDTLYESEVGFTPYTDDLMIDAVALGEMLDKAYRDAGRTPEQIDTGVVILTGEALRRRNAERITAVVAERAGDLVCASAGHHMEAMLAAYGSGAVRASHDRRNRLLNLDIGGGTTKLAVVEDGQVLVTGALHVGGRLLVVDDDGVLTRLEPAGRDHLAACGWHLDLGDHVDPSTLDVVADRMAGLVVEAVTANLSTRLRSLYLTEPVTDLARLDGIVVSGGVGEYVYGRESRDFGDLGRLLGAALRARLDRGEVAAPLLDADERIRATVLGASEYSVQLSGITGFIPTPETSLPRRNVQVVAPSYELGERVDADAVAEAIRGHVAAFGLDDMQGDGRGITPADVVVALTWSGPPAYPRLRAFGEGVVRGLQERISAGRPLLLMLDADVARTLGLLLRDELGVTNELVILDGLDLRDFDYVDLGRLREPSRTVPVTIKSLVFGDPAGLPA